MDYWFDLTYQYLLRCSFLIFQLFNLYKQFFINVSFFVFLIRHVVKAHIQQLILDHYFLIIFHNNLFIHPKPCFQQQPSLFDSRCQCLASCFFISIELWVMLSQHPMDHLFLILVFFVSLESNEQINVHLYLLYVIF